MKPIKRLSEFINESTPFIFLKICIKPEDKLNEHEYYIQMVTDNNNIHTSPHVKFIDPYTHTALVGVEKVSSKDDKGWYISKDFYKRNSRGIVCLINVKSEFLKDCTLLS